MDNKPGNITKLIEYPKEGILSKEIAKTKRSKISLFCMAKGSEISEHTSAKEGFIYVLEGRGVFSLNGRKIKMMRGVSIFMKQNTVHSLKAEENTSFLLFLVA